MLLIVGIPGENQEDIDMTKRLIAESKPEMGEYRLFHSHSRNRDL